MHPRLFAAADSAVAVAAGAISSACYVLGQTVGMPGIEYASFAGLLLLVLYWTQSRISYLDKQYEEREQRQAAEVAKLQEFIQSAMHEAILNLTKALQTHSETLCDFRDRLADLEQAIDRATKQ